MSLTGIFLILFLVVHLSGNLLLLNDKDGGLSFNLYAHFMTTNPLIKISSFLLYSTILLHVLVSLVLTISNYRARGGSRYANPKNKGASWNSRNMGILGSLVLVFLIIHMKDFWYEMHFGSLEMVVHEGVSYKNLYLTVYEAFQLPWYVILYTISMLALAFHLYHGFQSAFRTLGVSHGRLLSILKVLGIIYSVVVPLGFGLIPILMYFKP